jgi:hypothetical protein
MGMLSGLDTCETVGERQALPTVFATKTEAEKFIFQIKRQGSVQLAELGIDEKHVLGVIRQAETYEPRLLLEACQAL